MYERNNCGDNKMVNKDESLKNALTEGVVASILASIIMMAITTIVKYFLQEYSQILPELQSMIICMLVFLALIYLEYIWVKHNKKKRGNFTVYFWYYTRVRSVCFVATFYDIIIFIKHRR